MGVATDIHCSQTLYRRWNLWWLSFCWRKSWCGNGARSEWVINPLTHISHANTHFEGYNQDANLVGQNPNVMHPGGVRSVDGQEWVISPCFRPFSRLAHLTLTHCHRHYQRSIHTDANTLLHQLTAEEESYCFVQGDVVLEPTGVGFSRAPAPSISSEQLQVGSPQVNTSTSTCGWTSCCCSTCWGSGQSSYFLWPPWLVMWRLKRNHD